MEKKLVSCGKLYRGFTWEYAILDAINKFNNPIKPIYKATNPNLLLCDEKEFSHFELSIKDGGRKFTTKLPKELNEFLAKQLPDILE